MLDLFTKLCPGLLHCTNFFLTLFTFRDLLTPLMPLALTFLLCSIFAFASFCFILLRYANLKLVFRMLAWLPLDLKFFNFCLSGCCCFTGLFSRGRSRPLVTGSKVLLIFFLLGCLETNFGFSNLSLRMKTIGALLCLGELKPEGPTLRLGTRMLSGLSGMVFSISTSCSVSSLCGFLLSMTP